MSKKVQYTKEEYEECLQKAQEMADSIHLLMNSELGFEDFPNRLNNLKESYNGYRKVIYDAEIAAENRRKK